MINNRFRLEICLSPAIYSRHADDANVVVVADIFRASSAICTAFHNRVRRIIPVATVEEARQKKREGYLVASERDGYVLDFADFGKSPFNFTAEQVKDRDIVYCTTNGTRCIHLAGHSKAVVIGSFLNLTALSEWLLAQHSPVLILCASWKDRFSLEDTVFAGALSRKLLASGNFHSICDAVTASVDLWELARTDLNAYLRKAAQKERLAAKGLDDCIDFCLRLDYTRVVPRFLGGELVAG
ncbi:MAG: 2-phosphosulfolactate phosphatase [Mangrovibacterium sp.]